MAAKAINKRPAEQAAANEAGLHQSGQQITVMTAAQDLDTLLPGWTNLAFSAGQYFPFNLAMPLRLPGRAHPEANWSNDGPLSEIGKAMATIIGEALSGTSITKVVSSPAFRCVQTAQYVVKGIDNDNIKICVEPGLYDWSAFQTWPPKHLTQAELLAANVTIDEDYKAVMTSEDLTKCLHESLNDFAARKLKVAKELLAKSNATEHILLIAHATTIETIPRRLQGMRPAENIEEAERRMQVAGNHYPPSCMVTIKQTSDNAWQRSDDIIAPFISTSSDNTIDKDFYNGR